MNENKKKQRENKSLNINSDKLALSLLRAAMVIKSEGSYQDFLDCFK